MAELILYGLSIARSAFVKPLASLVEDNVHGMSDGDRYRTVEIVMPGVVVTEVDPKSNACRRGSDAPRLRA